MKKNLLLTLLLLFSFMSLSYAQTVPPATYNVATETIHVPNFELGGNNYWIDLKIVKFNPLQVELVNYGKSLPVNNCANCATFDTKNLMMHIPNFEFQNKMYWLDFKLISTNSKILMNFKSFGVINYKINVIVSGLTDQIEIKNKDKTFSFDSNGNYTIDDSATIGETYDIEIISHPAERICNITNNKGAVNYSNVNIFINCIKESEDVVKLNGSDLSAAIINNNSIEFNSLPQKLQNVKEGEILFSPEGEGLLKVVESVENVNGKTVISTKDGTLSDIIQEGRIKYSTDLGKATLIKTKNNVKSGNIKLYKTNGASSYCAGKNTEYVVDIEDVPVAKGIYLSGCYGFSMDFDTDVEIGWDGISYFKFVANEKVVSALELTKKRASEVSVKRSLASYTFLTPIPTPIPIPATTTISIVVSVGAGGEATISVGTGTYNDISAGAIYNNGEIERIGEINASFEKFGPTVDISGYVSTDLGPEVAYKICGIVGPQLSLKGFLELDANILKEPWWKLYAGVKATIDLVLNAESIPGFGLLNNGVSINLGTWNLLKKTLAQAPTSYESPNSPPKADFSYSPSSPKVNETVTFTNKSIDPDGDSLKYRWDFGDGKSSTLKNPVHKYVKSGNYTVTLRVKDSNGAVKITSKTIYVKDNTLPVNHPPKADFSYSPSSPKVNETVTFTNNSTDPDGDTLTYEWNFGDGTTSTLKNPTHTYSNSDNYTVILKVTDSKNSSNSVSKLVTVTQPSTSGNIKYYSGTGHYYEFVQASVDWHEAKNLAAAKTYNGKRGYLVTITSSGENDFVRSLIPEGLAAWLGATDEESEGVWKWATGPEAGTQFWQGDGDGHSVNGMFSKWLTTEQPAGASSPDEDYANMPANSKYNYGKWADGRGISHASYVIEYGGL